MVHGRPLSLINQAIHESTNPTIPFVPLTMDHSELTRVLVAMGCPVEKSAEMAVQLDKRARQLATDKGRTYEEALTHLLTLMRQGWAAKEKGF
jgi:hypothetical protein